MARKTAKDPADAPAAPESNTNGVASSKAQAVRDAYERLGTRTRPRDIMADLAVRGIDVSSAQVSMVRKQMGLRRLRRRGSARRGPAVAKPMPESVSVDHLIAVKRLADQVGGVKAALQAIKTLEKLR
jgi:hypothetical protein